MVVVVVVNFLWSVGMMHDCMMHDAYYQRTSYVVIVRVPTGKNAMTTAVGVIEKKSSNK